jgi:tellurite resistance protein TerC
MTLTAEFLDKPLWLWAIFLTVVVCLLAFDLGVLHRRSREIPLKESLFLSAAYILVAIAFGVWTWATLGSDAGAAFFSGYLLEKSLSLDNLFIISAIFGTLMVPRELQHRVLFWGILSVLALRALLIGLGAALVHEFAWVLPLFGAFLLYAGWRLSRPRSHTSEALTPTPLYRILVRRLPVTADLQGNRFFVRGATGRWTATPLFLALLLIELSDVMFAVDSVPAIFAVTTDPYLVYTSNIFAVLGLRALYFALADVINRLEHLRTAMGLLLALAGGKIFYNALVGKIDPLVSLAVTLIVLFGGMGYSVWRTRSVARPEPALGTTDRAAQHTQSARSDGPETIEEAAARPR